MSVFPEEGKARIVTDGERYYVIASLPKKTAENGARAQKLGEIDPAVLAQQIANTIDMLAMPGRIQRATV